MQSLNGFIGQATYKHSSSKLLDPQYLGIFLYIIYYIYIYVTMYNCILYISIILYLYNIIIYSILCTILLELDALFTLYSVHNVRPIYDISDYTKQLFYVYIFFHWLLGFRHLFHSWWSTVHHVQRPGVS